MSTTIEAGAIVELTVQGLDGRRLLIRGITDSPIRLRSAVIIPEPAPLPEGTIAPTPPKRRALPVKAGLK